MYISLKYEIPYLGAFFIAKLHDRGHTEFDAIPKNTSLNIRGGVEIPLCSVVTENMNLTDLSTPTMGVCIRVCVFKKEVPRGER